MIGSRSDCVQILQECIKLIQAGQSTLEETACGYPDLAGELRPRLEAAIWLQSQAASFDPRHGFVLAARRRLLHRLVSESSEARAPWSTRLLRLANNVRLPMRIPARIVLQLTVGTVLVLSLLTSRVGAVKAAQNSMPGEPFYNIKITFENVEIVTSFDRLQDAQLHVKFAERRLMEIQLQIMESDFESLDTLVASLESHISAAVAILESQPAEESQVKEAAEGMYIALSEQRELLSVLLVAAPVQSRLEVERALSITGEGLAAINSMLLSDAAMQTT